MNARSDARLALPRRGAAVRASEEEGHQRAAEPSQEPSLAEAVLGGGPRPRGRAFTKSYGPEVP